MLVSLSECNLDKPLLANLYLPTMAVISPRNLGVPLKETKTGTVVSIVLSLLSMAVLAVCLCM